MDEAFKSQVKEAFKQMFANGEIEIIASIGTDYDGKVITTEVTIDRESIYTNEERIY